MRDGLLGMATGLHFVGTSASQSTCAHPLYEDNSLIFRNSSSIFGLPFSKFALPGIRSFSRTRTALITPAIPLAPSRFPMLDFNTSLSELACICDFQSLVTLHSDLNAKSLIRGLRSPENGSNPIRFDRIANRGAGPVCFKETSALHT